MAQSNQSTTAHSAAISAISDARQNTRKYIYAMERSDRVQWDAIFVDPDEPEHPQKMAHAALMDFHGQVGQSEYIIKVDQLWQDNLEEPNGDSIEVQVPANDPVEITVDDKNGVDNMLPDRDDIETTAETVSLEMLHYRWSGRSVDVHATVDSPYYNADARKETLRLWLPPKAIVAAYDRLNDALSKLNLLAKTEAPIEHDPDPI